MRGAGRVGRVADGLVVPGMPGNAGGGKEPWFERDAERRKGMTTGESLSGSEKVRGLNPPWSIHHPVTDSQTPLSYRTNAKLLPLSLGPAILQEARPVRFSGATSNFLSSRQRVTTRPCLFSITSCHGVPDHDRVSAPAGDPSVALQTAGVVLAGADLLEARRRLGVDRRGRGQHGRQNHAHRQ